MSGCEIESAKAGRLGSDLPARATEDCVIFFPEMH